MSTVQLPQLRQGRDNETAVFKLINQLRRNVPGPTQIVQASGSVNLLVRGVTEIVPSNATGWMTLRALLIPDSIVGVQTVPPEIEIGIAPTYHNTIDLVNLGTALVQDQPIELTPFTSSPSLPVSETSAISVSVTTPASGPTELAVTFFLLGFYRP